MKPNASVDTSWQASAVSTAVNVRVSVVNVRHNGRAGCCANSPGPESEPLVRRAEPMSERTCSIDACPRIPYSLGYCRPHYRAFRKWGDPHRRPPTLAERVRSYYVVDPFGCWEWKGQLNNCGYGLIWVNSAGSKVAAHRVNYELLVGPIPDGLELDHLCSNPRCVNPSHLEPVTHAENMRRVSRHQVACRRAGHDWTDPRNVYTHPSTGRRCCRACARERNRKRGNS